MDAECGIVMRHPGLVQEILSVCDWKTQCSAARACRGFLDIIRNMPLRKLTFQNEENTSTFGLSRVGRYVVMKLLESSFSPRILSITFTGLSENNELMTLSTFDASRGQFPVETVIFDGGKLVPMNLADVGSVFPKLLKLKVSNTSVYVVANGLSLTANITGELWKIGPGFWEIKSAFQLIGNCMGSLCILKKEWMIEQYNNNERLKGQLIWVLKCLYPWKEEKWWNVHTILQLPTWQQQLCYSTMKDFDDDEEFIFEI